mgnify:CR=1 FL=1
MKNLKNKFDLSVTAYDEMFMTDAQRTENRLPKIYDLPITEIDNFPEHPFYVKDDDEMKNLVESIRDVGVLTPILVREKEDGRYELVSGHRRKHACELLGEETIPANIADMTHEQAIVAMVDANCQRTELLPSEKAFAYKMKYDAIKSMPQSRDQVGHGYRSIDVMAENAPDSRNQIQRFIRLTYLIKPFLDRVDNKEMAMGPAVELSYLDPEDQEAVLDIMVDGEVSPSLSQARQLHNISDAGFNVDDAEEILLQMKPNQAEKIYFSYERVGALIPQGLNHEEAEDFVVKSIEYYRHYRQMQKQTTR